MDKETKQIYNNLIEVMNSLMDASDNLIKSVDIGSKASIKRGAAKSFNRVSLDIMVRMHNLIEDYVSELSELAYEMEIQDTWDIDKVTGSEIAMHLSNKSSEVAKKFKKIK